MNKRIFVFLLLSVIWGSTWLFIKIGLDVLPPLTFAGIRFGCAALILWTIVLVRGSALPQGWRDWRVILWSGILGMAINYALIFWGEKFIPSGLAAVLQAMIPAFGLILAHYFLPNEKITWRKALGVATGILGVALIFSDQLKLEGTRALLGSAALFASAFFVAACNVLVKAAGRKLDPVVISAGQMTVGVIPLLLVGTILEGNPLQLQWTKAAVLALIYLVLIGSVLAFSLDIIGNRKISVTCANAKIS